LATAAAEQLHIGCADMSLRRNNALRAWLSHRQTPFADSPRPCPEITAPAEGGRKTGAWQPCLLSHRPLIEEGSQIPFFAADFSDAVRGKSASTV